jgi:hypothetical protein
VVWMEEVPDIYDALPGKEQEAFITLFKALRSAGGSLVASLQRNTFDQLPTIVRSQMASLCFGLNDRSEARFGLSERQQDAGANPAEWGTNYPGMAVLDAPGIEEGRVAMPLRTYAWGSGGDDAAAAALMEAHAAAFPAAARPVDPITAKVTGLPGAAPSPASPAAPARPVAVLTDAAPARPGAVTAGELDDDEDQDDEAAALVASYLRTEDPNPDLPYVDGDDPIEVQPDDEPFEFEQPADKLSPEAARAVLADQLAAWRVQGTDTFAPKDLRPVMARTGMRRGWIQARLRELLDDPESGVWREDDDEAGVYRLRAA